ncbi:M24 family metallopeptidase [Paenibacillus jilunlii]|uniref:Metallopeptidase n=2 Tax=Paenibacillus TaxID=44249 RepID=A0A1G9LKD3_9BACL|nr:Xaa-Pro peptidase family protein [Paenibacillus jilunlii]KWX74251.1 metallopeptidase [Paenibacillus jilunlii]SDL62356.1 Xaa-Pro aminopeptidase [Paenibacillus jilunlii]
MNEALSTLEQGMAGGGLDALLVTDPKHVYYLTGFASNPHERFLGLLLIRGGEPVLIVPALDAEAAHAASSVTKILTHSDTDNPYELLKSCFAGSKPGTVGIEKEHFTVHRYEQLAEAVPAEAFRDIGHLLRSMRAKKTPDEISRMKHAAELVEEVLRQGLTHVKAGVSEIELVAELDYLMKKVGASGPSFDTMVLSGPNTALPHGVPGSRIIQPGDFLMFDLGVYAAGYASDITRTFAVEEADPKLAEIYNTVLAANEAGIAASRAGATFGSVDRAARDVIEAAGYGEYFMHRVGHGLGMDTHEYPSLHGMNGDFIDIGNVFTVEPGIYVAGLGGVRIEDDVWITPEGPQTLTTMSKALTVLHL